MPTTSVLRQTRLAVLGEDELVVHGLSALLARSPSLQLVTAGDARLDSVDLVLADVSRCPDVETLQDLTRLVPPGRLVLFCWDLTPETASLGLHLGARGCLSKSLPAPVLVDALRRIARGETVVRGLLESSPAAAVAQLSHREAEVLALIASGATNQQITELLRVSPNTVKSYIRAAYRKIGVDSRSRAVLWAVRNGLCGVVGSGPRSPHTGTYLATPRPSGGRHHGVATRLGA
jgi:two-component system, NarL family, response regulator LiaR